MYNEEIHSGKRYEGRRGEGERGKERRETSGGGVERRIEEDGTDCEIGGNWKGQTYSDWIDNGFPLYIAANTALDSRPDICGIKCGNDGWRCTQAYEDV